MYDGAVEAVLVELWALFDYPRAAAGACCCGSSAAAEEERAGGVQREVAGKLVRMSARTGRPAAGGRKASAAAGRSEAAGGLSRLLLEQIPAGKWPTSGTGAGVGNVQLISSRHCGQSTAGDYLSTLSGVDIATQWWAWHSRPHAAVAAAAWMPSGWLPFRMWRRIRTTTAGC